MRPRCPASDTRKLCSVNLQGWHVDCSWTFTGRGSEVGLPWIPKAHKRINWLMQTEVDATPPLVKLLSSQVRHRSKYIRGMTLARHKVAVAKLLLSGCQCSWAAGAAKHNKCTNVNRTSANTKRGSLWAQFDITWGLGKGAKTK